MAAAPRKNIGVKPRAQSPAQLANLTGKGRPKGVPNKMTGELKDMILGALNAAHPEGGLGYLVEQSASNPVAFMTLVGKVLPLTVNGQVTGHLTINWGLPAHPLETRA